MTYVKIILLILQVVDRLLDLGMQNKYIKIGEDRVIGEQTAKILLKTQFAKEALATVSGKSDADVDSILRELEPKPGAD